MSNTPYDGLSLYMRVWWVPCIELCELHNMPVELPQIEHILVDESKIGEFPLEVAHVDTPKDKWQIDKERFEEYTRDESRSVLYNSEKDKLILIPTEFGKSTIAKMIEHKGWKLVKLDG